MKDNWLRLTTGFRLFERHSDVKESKCISELQVAELELVYCAHPLPRKYCQKGRGLPTEVLEIQDLAFQRGQVFNEEDGIPYPRNVVGVAEH